jgi:hypothetical protein
MFGDVMVHVKAENPFLDLSGAPGTVPQAQEISGGLNIKKLVVELTKKSKNLKNIPRKSKKRPRKKKKIITRKV